MKDVLGWDSNLAWFLLLCFLLNVGMGVFPPLLPQVMDSLGLSFAQAGLLGTAFGVTRFVMDLPVGFLAERVAFARILHAGMAVFLAGTLLAAWAPSFAAMLVARGLLGLASGTINVVGILYLMHTGAVAQRNRRANLYELSVIAGMAVSAELAGLVGGRWGWRWSFGSAALAFLAAWLVTVRLAPTFAGVQAALAPAAHGPRAARPWRLPSAALLAIYVAAFAQAFAWGGGISTLLPLYGGRALGFSPELVGGTMALAFWAEVCLLFPVGWAADAWGKVPVLLPGFTAVLLAVCLAPFAGGGAGYAAVFIIFVSGMSVWMLVPSLLAEHRDGGFGARSAGYYRLVTDFGFILAPAIVGWLIGRSGFGAASLAIAAVIALAILLLARFVGVKKR